ncbi:unnamed protein product, partial [Ceratitis capitata]
DAINETKAEKAGPSEFTTRTAMIYVGRKIMQRNFPSLRCSALMSLVSTNPSHPNALVCSVSIEHKCIQSPIDVNGKE